MSRMLKAALLVGAAFATPSGSAQAEPITYTFTGTGSGTFEGAAFTSQSFTITAVSDTSAVNPTPAFGTPQGYYTDPTSESITVNGVTVAVSSTQAFVVSTYGQGVYVDPSPTAYPPVYSVAGTIPGSTPYDMVSSFPTTTLTNPMSESIATIMLADGSTFSFNNGGVSSLSFSAVAVPEPASLTMLGIGLGGGLVLAARRRKKAKASVTA